MPLVSRTQIIEGQTWARVGLSNNCSSGCWRPSVSGSCRCAQLSTVLTRLRLFGLWASKSSFVPELHSSAHLIFHRVSGYLLAFSGIFEFPTDVREVPSDYQSANSSPPHFRSHLNGYGWHFGLVCGGHWNPLGPTNIRVWDQQILIRTAKIYDRHFSTL